MTTKCPVVEVPPGQILHAQSQSEVMHAVRSVTQSVLITSASIWIAKATNIIWWSGFLSKTSRFLDRTRQFARVNVDAKPLRVVFVFTMSPRRLFSSQICGVALNIYYCVVISIFKRKQRCSEQVEKIKERNTLRLSRCKDTYSERTASLAWCFL